MTDTSYDYDYAAYEGDSWERLDCWIDRRLDYELALNNEDGSQKVIVGSEIVSIEIKPTAFNQAAGGVSNGDDETIDLDIRNWDIYDFATAIGVILLAVGLIFALLPPTRPWGILFPIGAALMAFAAYGARRREAYSG